MYKLKQIENYESKLSLRDTQKAIVLIKDTFEHKLAKVLNLERISAPIIVPAGSGINDDLSGQERAVRFDAAKISDYEAEVVQSLAKWKRMALYEYGFKAGEGIYTDMNALRRDDEIDNVHSIYVDQWDWEFVITKEKRTVDFLQSVVEKIVDCIIETQSVIKERFKLITTNLYKKVFFISSQELFDLYPKSTVEEREHLIVKDKKTVFISQIGGGLSNGSRHGSRAPDYDDWQLNGDLIFWNELLEEPIEISSMGIRVDTESMANQLKATGNTSRLQYKYHQDILSNILPLTIGGGIGQSRLCMLILQKLHIGEVHASVWPKQMLDECKKAKIQLL